jgi:hypothetical protein
MTPELEAQKKVIECAVACGNVLDQDEQGFIAVEVADTLIVVAAGDAKRKMAAWLPEGLYSLATHKPARIEHPTAEQVAAVEEAT